MSDYIKYMYREFILLEKVTGGLKECFGHYAQWKQDMT